MAFQCCVLVDVDVVIGGRRYILYKKCVDSGVEASLCKKVKAIVRQQSERTSSEVKEARRTTSLLFLFSYRTSRIASQSLLY